MKRKYREHPTRGREREYVEREKEGGGEKRTKFSLNFLYMKKRWREKDGERKREER